MINKGNSTNDQRKGLNDKAKNTNRKNTNACEDPEEKGEETRMLNTRGHESMDDWKEQVNNTHR